MPNEQRKENAKKIHAEYQGVETDLRQLYFDLLAMQRKINNMLCVNMVNDNPQLREPMKVLEKKIILTLAALITEGYPIV